MLSERALPAYTFLPGCPQWTVRLQCWTCQLAPRSPSYEGSGAQMQGRMGITAWHRLSTFTLGCNTEPNKLVHTNRKGLLITGMAFSSREVYSAQTDLFQLAWHWVRTSFGRTAVEKQTVGAQNESMLCASDVGEIMGWWPKAIHTHRAPIIRVYNYCSTNTTGWRGELKKRGGERYTGCQVKPLSICQTRWLTFGQSGNILEISCVWPKTHSCFQITPIKQLKNETHF